MHVGSLLSPSLRGRLLAWQSMCAACQRIITVVCKGLQTVDVSDPPHLLPRSLLVRLTPLAMLLGRSSFSRSTHARRRDPPLILLLLGDALPVDRFSPIDSPPSLGAPNGCVLLLVARPRRGKTGLISSDKRSPSLSSSKVDPASGLRIPAKNQRGRSRH